MFKAEELGVAEAGQKIDQAPAERIIAAADKLFSQYGIKSVTMEDLSRELGISKKTLYQHFANKDALVMQWAKQTIHEMDRDRESTTASASNAIDEVFLFLRKHKEQLLKMNPLIFHDLIKYHPEALCFVREHRLNEEKNRIVDLIGRGVDEGLFAQGLHTEILARYQTHMKDICLNPEVFPPSEFHVFKVMHEIFMNFLTGLSTLKGHELINTYKSIEENNLFS